MGFEYESVPYSKYIIIFNFKWLHEPIEGSPRI